MQRSLLVIASIIAVSAALYACGSDSKPASTATDAGVSETGVADAGGTDSADAAPPVRCTQAEFDKKAGVGGGDFTALPGADISFPTDPNGAQYTNHCIKVKVGSTVTFAGSFTNHPLTPKGGDTPTPIPSQMTDTMSGAIVVTFATIGTYGFECLFHPTIMFGGVQVVP